MSKSIQRYVCENISIIMKIAIIYVIGILIGIVIFNFTNIKSDYIEIVKNIFDTTKQENFEGINVIVNGLKNNLFYILMLFLSLLTLIAPLIVCLFVVLKAIVTGIYICTIFSIFGFGNGIIVAILGVILPMLVSVPGYIFICTNIIEIYKYIHSGEKFELKNIVKQLYLFIISLSLISFSIVIEQLVSSIIFSIYNKI